MESFGDERTDDREVWCGVVEVKERKDWNLEQRKNKILKPRCSD